MKYAIDASAAFQWEVPEPLPQSVTSGFRLSFYDAHYVALAEREGCDLISGDDKLVRNHGCGLSLHQVALLNLIERFPLSESPREGPQHVC